MQQKFHVIKENKKPVKERFTIIVSSNNGTGKTKAHSISSAALTFWIYFMIILAVIILTYGVYTILVIGDGQGAVVSLRSQVEKLTEQSSTLITENADLTEKVTLLSDSLNIKLQQELENQEADTALHLPTSVPIAKNASMEEGLAIANTGAEVPAIIFSAKEDADVLATADGTVAYAGSDDLYGSRVMINHGNGYITVYKCSGQLMVREGEEITRNTVLFAVGTDAVIYYQIIKDDLYIDPMEIMEISG